MDVVALKLLQLNKRLLKFRFSLMSLSASQTNPLGGRGRWEPVSRKTTSQQTNFIFPIASQALHKLL